MPENRPSGNRGPVAAPSPAWDDLVLFLGASAEEWIAITGDVDRDAIVTFGLIEAIARTWKEIHAGALAHYDLNLAEWTTIGMLRSSPPEFRRSPTELRHLVGQTSAGMTRILTKLADGKLVRREPSRSDGRGHDVILTPRGNRLAKDSFRALHAIQRERLESIDTDARRRIVAALDALRIALSSPAGDR